MNGQTNRPLELEEHIMKRLMKSLGMMAVGVLLLSHQATAAAQSTSTPILPRTSAVVSAQPDATLAWPVVFNVGGSTYTVFASQSDAWDGHAWSLAVRSVCNRPPTCSQSMG